MLLTVAYEGRTCLEKLQEDVIFCKRFSATDKFHPEGLLPLEEFPGQRAMSLNFRSVLRIGPGEVRSYSTAIRD